MGRDDLIPFYGAEEREMFALERTSMDRSGAVTSALEAHLSNAQCVLDIGAGDGFTAERLTTPLRTVIPLEPSEGMIDRARDLPWIRGSAKHLPLLTDSVDATYATWAYFFPSVVNIDPGLSEANRVTRPGGPIVIVDNAGEDEFTSMAHSDIATDQPFWRRAGFKVEVVESAFEFDSLKDAERLLRFYFGDRARPAKTVPFRVAIISKSAE